MRRLVTVDMVANKRINETAFIRRKCIDNMQLCVEEEASKVEEGRGVHGLGGYEFGRRVGVFKEMKGLMEWNGNANVVDFFPWLRWLDPQGLKRKMKRELGKAIQIASKFFKERIQERDVGGEKTMDFLDVLLEFEGDGIDKPAKISDHDLIIFILEIFRAGLETTSSTTEWALTELLCNPATLIEAKAELTQVIGPSRKIEEGDIDNLPYLQGIINQTLRLHPSIPFLVPRKAMHDTSLHPKTHRMLHLTFGMLLHRFDWSLDANVTRETMDWKDKLGITMTKSEPLLAVP
ncbi:hypothetical protein C1H46_032239 [Malus baccata]|uniref:Cytochrome P450 n=1 Tax=Malus baccata TaxID=106549 RepID=A0A540L6W5_MALBA|nr:hypothetical protein C1H46_032239 [Malus baccata]